MELMHRLGDEKEDKYYDDYLELIKKNPGCCDTVWFVTIWGYPPLEKHRERVAFYKKFIEKFKSLGIKTSLQVANTIGHGDCMSNVDYTGLLYEGSRVENAVGSDGKQAKRAFCWNGEVFKKYILEMIAIYAELEPDCVWIDDDFRPRNHDPIDFCCFCDDCIEKFNQKHNSAFSREELVSEILYGDLIWRERWIKFVQEGMAQLMREIGETLHKISPESELGYQYGANGSYTGHGYAYVFDAMKESTGKAPKSRPGGGAYFDLWPDHFWDKGITISWENSMLPDYVVRKCPEVESLPNVAFGKTPSATAFETSLYFAYGNTDMTYAIGTHFNDVLDHYDKLFHAFSLNREYWEKLSSYAYGTYQSGLRYYMSKNGWKKRLQIGESIHGFNNEPFKGVFDLTRNAIPFSMDEKESGVLVLHPEVAKILTDEEIKFLLTKNVITDAETIKILQDKIDLGLEIYEKDRLFWLSTEEQFLPHVTCPKQLKSWYHNAFLPGKGDCFVMRDVKGNAGVLSVYANNVSKERYSKENKEYLAEVVVETGAGGRWAVFAYAPWRGIVSSLKRDALLNVADYISRNALSARLYSLTPCVLLPRKDDTGKTVCVSIANASMGKREKDILMIDNPQTENFLYMAQYGVKQLLPFTQKEGRYYVELPEQDAFTVATVFCGEE